MVTTSWAAVTQCSATVPPVSGADPAGQLVQVETVVVQDPLAWRQAYHLLQEVTVAVGLGELHHVLDAEVRGGLRDAGDAVGRQPSTDLGQPHFAALQGVRPVLVGAAEPSIGMVRQPNPGQSGRVQRPQDSTSVLHAYRHGGRHVVQRFAVQRSGDGFVVSHRPDPAVLADRGLGQHAGEVVSTVHLPRPDRYRRQGRCGGMQVDVVIVQAGDDGVLPGVEHRLPCGRREVLGYVDDALFGTDVDDCAVEQARALNQHAANLLSVTNRCTRAVSAPSSAAGDATTGAAGATAAQSLSLRISGTAA
jgi:hypothetical protein